MARLKSGKNSVRGRTATGKARSAGPAGEGARGVVQLEGPMTIYRAADLQAELAAHLEGGARCLDLAGVTEFDSAGLQLLASARASAAQRGKALKLAGAPECVRELCAVYGLLPWLDREST